MSLGLNNRFSGYFLFDTGTNVCFLSDTVATQLNLPRTPATGDDGRPLRVKGKQGSFVYVPSVQMGSFAFFDFRFVLLKGEELRSSLEEPVDGIIGANFFTRYAALFDFQKHEITVFDPGNFSPEELKQRGMDGAIIIPIDYIKGSLLFAASVRFNNTEEEELVIDTGAERSLISPRLAHRLNLQPTERGIESVTFYGNLKLNSIKVPTLSLSELTIPNVEVSYAEKAKTQYDSVLGLNVLARYRMLIDLPQKKMYLKPVSARTDSSQTSATPATEARERK